MIYIQCKNNQERDDINYWSLKVKIKSIERQWQCDKYTQRLTENMFQKLANLRKDVHLNMCTYKVIKVVVKSYKHREV